MVARCANLREINLSGSGDGPNRDKDRDSDLEAIAVHGGGNVILILERDPAFVRGRVYRCRKAEEAKRGL